MVESEAVSILRLLKANYPQAYKVSPQDANDIVNLWMVMFNEPFEVVFEAVKALICTNTFPPSIADVKNKIQLICTAPQLTEIEAWGLVYKAISNSYYNAQESFDSLPKVIQEVVKTPLQLREWSMMDTDTVSSVISSNFMRSYKVKAQHFNELQKLPTSTKNMLEHYKQKLLLEEEGKSCRTIPVIEGTESNITKND